MRRWIAVLMAACAPAETPRDGVDVETDAAVDTAGQPWSEDALSSVAQAVEGLAPRLAAFGLGPLRDALVRFHTLEDPACPGGVETPLGQGIHHDCVTGAGVRFFGAWQLRPEDEAATVGAKRSGIIDVYAPRLDPAWTAGTPVDEVRYTGVSGHFLVAPVGDGTLQMDGGAYGVELRAGDLVATLVGVVGAVVDALAYPGTWTDDGLVPDLQVGFLQSGGSALRIVQGDLSGLPAPWVAARAEQLWVSSACPAEPTGALFLRDADGAWVELRFDGEGACDGCAPVWVLGREVGVVCPDVTALLAPSPPFVDLAP